MHPEDSSGAKAGKSDGKTEKRKKMDEEEKEKEHKKVKQETKALKAKRPGFTEERYQETSYFIENGLRKVYPYYFTFTTFCKGRWVGQPILQVFAKEFRAHPPEEYERCLKSGSLTVNYKSVNIDYILQHNDLLANTVHRHEVPIANIPIQIIHISDDLVVVDKPSSIPVHPCGRYRHNTVVFILAKEFNLKNLRTIHRLDRLTSGLLLFGRTLNKARQLEQEIRSRLVSKEYVCRVEGKFPDQPIVCEESIEVVSYKIGVCRVGPNGKACRTEFSRLSYDNTTSVVLCKPHTGRMHQIRVHLQYLGYPIVNDPLYNHSVFGPEKGKNGNIGKSNEQLIEELIQIHNAENWLGSDDDDMLLQSNSVGKFENCDTSKNVEIAANKSESTSKQEDSSLTTSSPDCSDTKTKDNSVSDTDISSLHADDEEDAAGTSTEPIALEVSKLSIDPNCYECKVKFRDPSPKQLVMFLHAWKYKGPDWGFETNLPDWASEDWVDANVENVQ